MTNGCLCWQSQDQKSEKHSNMVTGSSKNCKTLRVSLQQSLARPSSQATRNQFTNRTREWATRGYGTTLMSSLQITCSHHCMEWSEWCMWQQILFCLEKMLLQTMKKFKCSVSTGFCLLEFLRTFGQAAPQFKHLARWTSDLQRKTMNSEHLVCARVRRHVTSRNWEELEALLADRSSKLRSEGYTKAKGCA